jgi:hypothetical protein
VSQHGLDRAFEKTTHPPHLNPCLRAKDGEGRSWKDDEADQKREREHSLNGTRRE